MPNYTTITVRKVTHAQSGTHYAVADVAHGGDVSERRFRWVAEEGSRIVLIAVQPLEGMDVKRYHHDWEDNEIRITVKRKRPQGSSVQEYNLIYKIEEESYSYCEAYGMDITWEPDCVGTGVTFKEAQHPPPEIEFP